MPAPQEQWGTKLSWLRRGDIVPPVDERDGALCRRPRGDDVFTVDEKRTSCLPRKGGGNAPSAGDKVIRRLSQEQRGSAPPGDVGGEVRHATPGERGGIACSCLWGGTTPLPVENGGQHHLLRMEAGDAPFPGQQEGNTSPAPSDVVTSLNKVLFSKQPCL